MKKSSVVSHVIFQAQTFYITYFHTEIFRRRGYFLRETTGIPICFTIIIHRPNCCPSKIEKNSGDSCTKFSFHDLLFYFFEIQGHLVLLPLNFMSEEDLTPASGTPEALMPMSLWT